MRREQGFRDGMASVKAKDVHRVTAISGGRPPANPQLIAPGSTKWIDGPCVTVDCWNAARTFFGHQLGISVIAVTEDKILRHALVACHVALTRPHSGPLESNQMACIAIWSLSFTAGLRENRPLQTIVAHLETSSGDSIRTPPPFRASMVLS